MYHQQKGSTIQSMSFNKAEVAKLLVQCQRRCCVCHRFCGVKIELHHIEQKAKGGSDSIDNAIPLCFECHAEVNHYNDSHPRGRKFTNEELIGHKDYWINTCKDHPEALITAPRDIDIGPLEGMMLELEHNNYVVNWITDGSAWQNKIGSVLNNSEYIRSVSQGALLLLPIPLRTSISAAYTAIGRVNSFVSMYTATRPEGNAGAEATNKLLDAYRDSREYINEASVQLSRFLQNDNEESEVSVK